MRCTIGAVEIGTTATSTTTSVTVIPGTFTAGTRVDYLVVVTPQSGTAVGGREILPVDGHGVPRWRPGLFPGGGHEFSP